MKKWIALFLCLLLTAGTVGVTAESLAVTAAAGPLITTKNFPVYALSVTDVWREDFPVYFVDGAEDLPFIDLADWKDFLIYAYDRIDSANGDKVFGLTMEVQEEERTVVLTRETGADAMFDFENRQIVFEDYVAFIQPANVGYMEITGIPEMRNNEPFLLQRTKDRNLYGEVTVVDLKEYDIPMIAQDGKYLLPLQTLSGFMLSHTFAGVYFNGESLFMNVIPEHTDPWNVLENNLSLNGLLTADVIAKYQAYEGTAEESLNYLLRIIGEASGKGKELIEQYRINQESSLYLKYRSAPKAARSEALIEYGINELALELDCFYGLKESHNIRDFRLFFLQNELGDGLIDPDAAKADQAVADLMQYWFDDSHSAFISSSYLSSQKNAEANPGFSTSAGQALYTELDDLRARYPNATLPYYEVGDTAYISFDEFVCDLDEAGVVDYYKLVAEGKMPSDTLGIISEAHRQIIRENSPIKNVVLDLSANNGGMNPAAYFTMAWFLGEANYSFQNTFTGAQTTHYFRADVNFDHQFDGNDTLAGRGLKLYCLISPGSFSCANLVACAFKESGKVTLLGRTSGGGSCVVGYNTTAWGTSYQYSSSNRLAFVKNGSYYDVEQGAEPDYMINDYSHYYDREALTEFIHGLY